MASGVLPANREGGFDDLDGIMRVMMRAFDPLFGEAWTRPQVEALFPLPGLFISVAEDEDAIVGFAITRFIADEGELLLLAVDPAFRGRGIGRALIITTLDTARRLDMAHLHLEVRANNKAIELYEDCGFVHCRTRPDYYRGTDGQPYDAQSYSMNLLNP